jgi:hypothetical protein
MEKMYFTIAGMKRHYGNEFMEVKLVKEPDNEAIKVGLDKICVK